MKNVKKFRVIGAAATPPGSVVAIRWHEEVEMPDNAEDVERRKSFEAKWVSDAKVGGKRSRTANSKACEVAWDKAQATFSLTDADWVRVRHRVAKVPSWCGKPRHGSGHQLPAELAFDRQNFTVATLNCGYGASGLRLNGKKGKRTGAWLDRAFAECIKLRSDYLVSTIDFSTVKLQPFMSHFETSDRADVSFLIGSATSYLVADAWLTIGGRNLVAFWHVALYCAALVEGDGGRAFKNTDIAANEKAPDFLAVDDKGEVHLFESKGGRASKNNEVIRRALDQLTSIKKVSLYELAGRARKAKVATRMAVRTIVEPGSPISVLAYDPPAAGTGTHLRIELNVARAMQVLESERLFENLRSPEWQLDYQLWVREIEGTHLVMCSSAPYRELRQKLRAYLAVKQTLPVGEAADEVGAEGTAEPGWRRIAREVGSRALADHDDEVQQQFNQALVSSGAPGALLPALSRSLGIPVLMAAFDKAIEAAQFQLDLWGNTVFQVRILPGLLIQLVNWDGDMRRKRAHDSSPPKKL